MKKFLTIALIALLVVGGAIWYFTAFKLDGVVRQTIEEAATNSFGTPVTVSSLKTDLKAGSLTIGNISIANPPGYKNPIAFSLNSIEAAVDYENFEIKRVIIQQPEIIIEEKGGETNFSRMMASMESEPEETETAPTDEEPIEIAIHHFRMDQSRAAFESESLEHYSDLEIDAVELKNIRGTPSEVAELIANEVMEEIVSEAAKELLKAKASEKMDELLGRD